MVQAVMSRGKDKMNLKNIILITIFIVLVGVNYYFINDVYNIINKLNSKIADIEMMLYVEFDVDTRDFDM